MLWLNFLHLYQPANSPDYIIKEATEKSYLRIIRALEEHPDLHFTFNITGCLFLRWDHLSYQDIFKRLRNLIDKGQLELTGTLAYHPIMPLIDEKEARWQIKENERIVKKYLGNVKLKGFFLPEMAYSPASAKLIKKLNYKWIILDDFHFGGEKIDFNKFYKDEFSALRVIFRSRKISNSFVPETLDKLQGKEDIVITATDAELYGLRHNDPTAEFEKIVKNKNIKTKTISEHICKTRMTPIKIISASWETEEKDLKEKNPYPLWQNKKNKIQNEIWRLANLAYKTMEDNKKDANYKWARWHFVRGLASCTFWWASGKDFRKVFGPLAWSPDEIEKGTNELIRVIRSLNNPKSKQVKLKAEKIHTKIKEMVWEKHWKNFWP